MVEGGPGVIGWRGWRGKGVADLLAGKAAVFVAKHEHVQRGSGWVVHEVH